MEQVKVLEIALIVLVWISAFVRYVIVFCSQPLPESLIMSSGLSSSLLHIFCTQVHEFDVLYCI